MLARSCLKAVRMLLGNASSLEVFAEGQHDSRGLCLQATLVLNGRCHRQLQHTHVLTLLNSATNIEAVQDDPSSQFTAACIELTRMLDTSRQEKMRKLSRRLTLQDIAVMADSCNWG